MMTRTRESIEAETDRGFRELMWKRQSFQAVSIDDEYSMSLIHVAGYDCLGTLSAAERQLLALSFVLALHKVSGFDSPILIDTPVARVSDQHRRNLGEVFRSVGGRKQIVLLLTPAEYSKEIREPLDPASGGRYTVRLSQDEREATLEVM